MYNGTIDTRQSTLDKYDSTDSEAASTDFITLINLSPGDLMILITECRFGRKECDIETDFISTLTRLGVCWTFNSGQSGRAIRRANGAGVRNGLQLKLNINLHHDICWRCGGKECCAPTI